jgi:hypothetical protein
MQPGAWKRLGLRQEAIRTKFPLWNAQICAGLFYESRRCNSKDGSILWVNNTIKIYLILMAKGLGPNQKPNLIRFTELRGESPCLDHYANVHTKSNLKLKAIDGRSTLHLEHNRFRFFRQNFTRVG